MRQLKAWATQMATTNLFAHSGSQLYGENLYGQFGAGPLNSFASCSTLGSTCVSSWYSEISMYNFNSPGYSDATGHYTQVVWKSTTMLGMGLGWGIKSGGVNSYYCVGQYSPPGNNVMSGQFLANVLPPLSTVIFFNNNRVNTVIIIFYIFKRCKRLCRHHQILLDHHHHHKHLR